MNSDVLQKCVDELAKDTPRLDYIRGMLEVLLSLNKETQDLLTHPSLHDTAMKVANEAKTPLRINGELTDEAAILDAEAKAKLAFVKGLAPFDAIDGLGQTP